VGPFAVASGSVRYVEAGADDADAEIRLSSDNGDVSVTALE
jgi:uncharacterized protein YaiI (UPF0178 family)